jgi:hypothetical protein
MILHQVNEGLLLDSALNTGIVALRMKVEMKLRLWQWLWMVAWLTAMTITLEFFRFKFGLNNIAGFFGVIGILGGIGIHWIGKRKAR